MRTATETKMSRVTALAVKVFWGITLVKLAIVVYLLITYEELRAYSTNMLGFYAMKPSEFLPSGTSPSLPQGSKEQLHGSF